MSQPPKLLAHLSNLLDEELTHHVRPDSCIAATRIVSEVLAHFSRDVRPLVVEAFLFNQAFQHQVERHGRWPKSREELLRWTDQGEAWSVGLGARSQPAEGPDKWPGHLVAIIENRWLLDGSLRQARRPSRDLLPPRSLLVEVDEFFLAGEQKLVRELPDPGGVLLYRAHPEATDFRKAPDWSDPGRFDSVVKDWTGRLSCLE